MLAESCFEENWSGLEKLVWLYPLILSYPFVSQQWSSRQLLSSDENPMRVQTHHYSLLQKRLMVTIVAEVLKYECCYPSLFLGHALHSSSLHLVRCNELLQFIWNKSVIRQYEKGFHFISLNRSYQGLEIKGMHQLEIHRWSLVAISCSWIWVITFSARMVRSIKHMCLTKSMMWCWTHFRDSCLQWPKNKCRPDSCGWLSVSFTIPLLSPVLHAFTLPVDFLE